MELLPIHQQRKKVKRGFLLCVLPYFLMFFVQFLDWISVSNSSVLGAPAMIGPINVAPIMFLLLIVAVPGMAIAVFIAAIILVYWFVCEFKYRSSQKN